jgi:hypothetical protein
VIRFINCLRLTVDVYDICRRTATLEVTFNGGPDLFEAAVSMRGQNFSQIIFLKKFNFLWLFFLPVYRTCKIDRLPEYKMVRSHHNAVTHLSKQATIPIYFGGKFYRISGI